MNHSSYEEEQKEEQTISDGGELTKEQEQSFDLLTDLGVSGPVARKLARTAGLADVRDWLVYAESADSLRDPAAFVVKMLLDGEPAPGGPVEAKSEDRYKFGRQEGVFT